MSVFSFKDAAKIKSWDAWSDHERTAEPASVLAREKPCVTWTALNALDPGLAPLGRLATRTSAEIRDSGWDVNCACLDRDYADWDAFKELLPMLGAKHARFISGWAKTEQEKGVYDFSWLDPHIRECAATGVRPWIALAYGNPVWGSDFRLGMRVRQITGDPAAFDAWIRYCTAVVERYRDVVDEWEVWNEPFGQGPDYALLFHRTAKAIRAVQPEAKVICTACTFPDDYRCVLETLKAAGDLGLGSLFSYHPYWNVPEGDFRASRPDGSGAGLGTGEALRAFVKRYDPRFDAMMGEAGCPAQLEFSHALPNHPWTELSQAKWNLRRALLDAAAGMRSSLFSMIDCQYTFMLQSFGLVRSNALKEFVYRRPAWFAMRNVYGLLDREARPLGPARRDGAILRADFERGGARLAFLWFADGTPSDDRFFEAARLAHGFRDPVWVEMVTGRAFALPADAPVPLWDSPVLLCERGAVPLVQDPPAERPPVPVPAIRPGGTPEGRTDADGAPRPLRHVRRFVVDGRPVALAEGEDILDLAALLPGVAVPGRNGGRAADVAFRVVADAAGSYRFRITNDYFGEIVANGVPLGAFENPNSWCEWTDVRVPLREGANEIVVRTRAGGGGVWHLGVRLPPAGVVAA